MPKLLLTTGLFLSILIFIGCGVREELTILSGSENETLEPFLKEFGRQTGIKVNMIYKGSVDIMLALKEKSVPFDAVWPAQSLWITLGDNHHQVKHTKSIMTSPVVFGIRKELAKELGFTGSTVSIKDIMSAISDKRLKFMMTSATQSNSGASAYLGFLYALLDNPDILTVDKLHSPGLKEKIRSLMSGINRSSGSSGWLKDLFLSGSYDAMVNYEALIIETNRELISQGREPLYVVYPSDGTVISDSPLGFIGNAGGKKETAFKKLQEYLLSQKTQEKIEMTGRRTGIEMLTKRDPAIFNPDWGIRSEKILNPIPIPKTEVIQEALYLYQTEFKKPSFTIFCLDFSGSMGGDGEKQLKMAMKTLLDQKLAAQYFLQSSSDDRIIVLPFNHQVITKWSTNGNDKESMRNLLDSITNLSPFGNTDIYSPVIEAVKVLAEISSDNYIPAVVLMSDGVSNSGSNFRELKAIVNQINKDIPVFSILFGEADKEQLKEISENTRGRVFDGRKDLITAFKNAKGYN